MQRRSGARLRHENWHNMARRSVSITLCVAMALVVAAGRTHTTRPTHMPQGDVLADAVRNLPSRAILPPNHPAANVQNQVGFNCDQFALDNTPNCIYSALLNISYARSLEGVGPMILPNNYAGLAPAQQLFVLFNLERTSRGLPAVAELDATAD